ncbi:hypothetical protein ATJ88_2660 [Isoptericola jiangsuensis]|uniref:Uncharacterized protein n=1 Tax=Isoptericola jiangsuensis TaxID=548579 RepID=A0A2A9EY09_9MICO|nr:hypothetical protein [Isoptericola jiangsuensis]PFG43944.1 hypothetical protein ATJ88_2660 [Isoptericola jiangsuensis]
MLQRILGAVLAVLGLGVIAFGVASATVLKESDTVVATARPAGDGTVVVTDPGVLGMVGTDVTVTASVPDGQQVTLVVGRDVDALGWLGEDAYTRVTGMTDWETLSTTQVAAATPEEGDEAADAEAEEAAPALLDPRGSDLWLSEQTEPGEVTLRWSDRPGPWVVMAAATGAAPAEEGEGDAAADEATQDEAAADTVTAPTLRLTWVRDVATPLLWPAVGVGAVLLLVGVVMLVVGRRRQRRAARSARSAQSPTSSASAASAGSPAGDGPVSPWTSPAAGAGWPAAAAPGTAPAPAPAQPDAEPAATESTPDDEREGSGTAPVPVAGRFSRRSRLGQRPAPAAEPEADLTATAVHEPVPAAPASPVDEPEPITGTQAALRDGRPLTRRELRLQEEERRQAGGTGMGRALRALTGQTPVVPPPPDGTPGAAPGRPEPTDRSRRSAAWRQTWGFDAGAADRDTGTDDTTDEGNR